jgi:hypothetical protein
MRPFLTDCFGEGVRVRSDDATIRIEGMNNQ